MDCGVCVRREAVTGSVVGIGGVPDAGGDLESEAPEAAHAQRVAPLLDAAGDQQIGEAALRADELACGFGPVFQSLNSSPVSALALTSRTQRSSIQRPRASSASKYSSVAETTIAGG